MKSNNGWYSVFDKEHRPESGREYLVLASLYDNTESENPLEDPENRVYLVATWYDKGDIYYDEVIDVKTEEDIYGEPIVAPRSGFYIQQPQLRKRSNTRGGELEPYGICQEWYRLKPMGEGHDNLICWKELDYPEN